MPIATGVRYKMSLAAVLAPVTMAAQRRGATGQQCPEDFPVRRRQLWRKRIEAHTQHFGQAQSRRLNRGLTAGHTLCGVVRPVVFPVLDSNPIVAEDF